MLMEGRLVGWIVLHSGCRVVRLLNPFEPQTATLRLTPHFLKRDDSWIASSPDMDRIDSWMAASPPTQDARKRNACILYATHIFDGLEDWLDSVAFVSRGKLQFLKQEAELPEIKKDGLLATVSGCVTQLNVPHTPD